MTSTNNNGTYELRGTRDDDETSIDSGFMVVANAKNSKFKWVAGTSCGTVMDVPKVTVKYVLLQNEKENIDSGAEIASLVYPFIEVNSSGKIVNHTTGYTFSASKLDSLLTDMNFIYAQKGKNDANSFTETSTKILNDGESHEIIFGYVSPKITVKYVLLKNSTDDLSNGTLISSKQVPFIEVNDSQKIVKHNTYTFDASTLGGNYRYVKGRLDAKNFNTKNVIVNYAGKKNCEVIFGYVSPKVTVRYVLLQNENDELATGSEITSREYNFIDVDATGKIVEYTTGYTFNASKVNELMGTDYQYVKGSKDGESFKELTTKVDYNSLNHEVIFGYIVKPVETPINITVNYKVIQSINRDGTPNGQSIQDIIGGGKKYNESIEIKKGEKPNIIRNSDTNSDILNYGYTFMGSSIDNGKMVKSAALQNVKENNKSVTFWYKPKVTIKYVLLKDKTDDLKNGTEIIQPREIFLVDVDDSGSITMSEITLNESTIDTLTGNDYTYVKNSLNNKPTVKLEYGSKNTEIIFGYIYNIQIRYRVLNELGEGASIPGIDDELQSLVDGINKIKINDNTNNEIESKTKYQFIGSSKDQENIQYNMNEQDIEIGSSTVTFWYTPQVAISYVLLSDENSDLNSGRQIESKSVSYFNERGAIESWTFWASTLNTNTGVNGYQYVKGSLDDVTFTTTSIEVGRDGKNHEVIFGYVYKTKVQVQGVCVSTKKMQTLEEMSEYNIPVDKSFNAEDYKDSWPGYKLIESPTKYRIHSGDNCIWNGEGPNADEAKIQISQEDYLEKPSKYVVDIFFEPKYTVTVNHIYVDADGNETKFSEETLPITEKDTVISSRNVSDGITINGEKIDKCVYDHLTTSINGGETETHNENSYTVQPDANYEVNFYYTSSKAPVPSLIFGGEDPNTPDDDGNPPEYPEGQNYDTLREYYGTGIHPVDRYNQNIGSKDADAVWVLDQEGIVNFKLAYTSETIVKGSATANIQFPFDVYVGNEIKKAGSTIPVSITVDTQNKTNFNDVYHYLTGSITVKVPIWVKEAKYDNIIGTVTYQTEEGKTITSTASASIRVVGQVYDFSITNLHDGDKIWQSSLFASHDGEYEAKELPIGQGNEQQNAKYNNGIMKGTKFYFSINTKGEANDLISIKPSFYYIAKGSKDLVAVNLYQNGKAITDATTRITSITDKNRTTTEYQNERNAGASIYSEEYKTTGTTLGTYNSISIGKILRTPYVGYVTDKVVEDYKKVQDANDAKAKEALYKTVSHWYGDYTIPNNVTYREEGSNTDLPKDGTLVVYFSVITKDQNGNEYLAYNLPSPDTNDGQTQWAAENLNKSYVLPHTVAGQDGITIENRNLQGSGQDGAVAVAIYGTLSTAQNYDTTGTH